jgi:DNA polymerase-3 subunit gamma/tau
VALALYRKYRPRTFAEVIGQEHVTEPLMQALRSGRLNHAYLFSGPRGCGKTSSARILARSLNCERGPTPEPCGECDSCVALAPDGPGSIDVIEIDAASHGGVDDARDLRERAIFAPAASRYKVYVIDEAHMVSSAGFNALLKLVEEPPDYVKFVFATTEPEKVLGTIKSRTHHYPFRLIPPGVLRPYLEELCQREGVAVEPAVYPLVVRAGGGSVRDSLSVLDQLIAGAGAQGVTYARAAALLGVTDAALIDEACDALAAGDGAAVFATIDRVAEAGHDPRRFASDLLDRLRDLIVLQQVPDAAGKGLLDAPADQLDRMALQAQRFGPGTLSRCADIVHNGLVEMRGTTAPRLLLELIAARMLLPGADDSGGALLQRLERMERRLGAASHSSTEDSERPQPGSRSAAAHPASAPPQEPPAPAGTERPESDAPAASAGSASSTPSPARSDQARSASAGAAPTDPALTGRASAGSGSAGAASARSGTTGPSTTGPSTTGPSTTGPSTTGPSTTGPSTTGSSATGSSATAASPAAVATTAGPGAIDAAAVRRVWEEVLTMVGRKSKRAAAVVREATVRDVDGDTLVLAFRHAVHADMLTASPELLVEAVYEVLGGDWQIRCELSGDRRPGRPAPAPRQTVDGPAPAAGATARASEAADEEKEADWPTPAQLGGAAAVAPVDPSPEPVPPPPVPAAQKSVAARGRRPAIKRGSAAAERTPEKATESDWDDEPAPDDEVVDEQAARQTSDQQALTLLQQSLGAEKIGDG